MNKLQIHPLKCYGSENTNSSEFKQVNSNDSCNFVGFSDKTAQVHCTTTPWRYTFNIIFIPYKVMTLEEPIN